MKVMMIFLSLMLAAPSIGTAAAAMDIPDRGTVAAKLYAEQCSACHSLPHPGRLDWQHWRSMLRVMKHRMDERGMSMPDADWRRIAAYLKAHAR